MILILFFFSLLIDLQSLRERSLSCKEGVRALAQAASQRFAQLDQAKPAEVDKHVAILELLSEKVLAAMEEKENEAKRARTVRYEYHRDVEQVQTWICQAEGRVQDRNLEPQTLKEFLQVCFVFLFLLIFEVSNLLID